MVERLVDVGTTLVADGEAAEAGEPSQRALDDPAVAPQALGTVDAASGDARHDPAVAAGTVDRQDLVAAAREAADNRFDVLIACAFNFDAHSSELGSLGSLRILQARINSDMHMSDELKNTGRGNMFVVFGEPDVDILDDGGPEIRVRVNGVDVFDPNTGDIRSNDTPASPPRRGQMVRSAPA